MTNSTLCAAMAKSGKRAPMPINQEAHLLGDICVVRDLCISARSRIRGHDPMKANSVGRGWHCYGGGGAANSWSFQR